mgnify:CR=1 FL=1
MKLIIAGGRDYFFDEMDLHDLDRLLEDYDITEVVSGKATGADTEGEKWAKVNNIDVEPFPADWDKYGKLIAGRIRNGVMARYADALAIFSGGSGSVDMLKQAKKEGLTIFDFRFRNPTFEEIFGDD